MEVQTLHARSPHHARIKNHFYTKLLIFRNVNLAPI